MLRNVLLAIVYVVVIVPVGLIIRAVRDPLSRQLDRSAGSYWLGAHTARGTYQATGSRSTP
ncbi:hypothetical protein EV193_11649 [Herbihabitans rhizosphaerae]|uniref:Uncharacterized protein n=1 Tax=Herbihabitans rhizosphaerae TaxID=1872711 RepID=A0A4Q7KDT2_9PSEU|nr:hypothetical protein [Herbihabitans rhizosphaerae]RZS30529.1 hypothetical protein EV193_11649 [Herbihabitans rhizosphaerae]